MSRVRGVDPSNDVYGISAEGMADGDMPHWSTFHETSKPSMLKVCDLNAALAYLQNVDVKAGHSDMKQRILRAWLTKQKAKGTRCHKTMSRECAMSLHIPAHPRKTITSHYPSTRSDHRLFLQPITVLSNTASRQCWMPILSQTKTELHLCLYVTRAPWITCYITIHVRSFFT